MPSPCSRAINRQRSQSVRRQPRYSEGAGAVVIEQGTNATVTDVDSAISAPERSRFRSRPAATARRTCCRFESRERSRQIRRVGSNVTFAGTTIGSFTAAAAERISSCTFQQQCDGGSNSGADSKLHLSEHRHRQSCGWCSHGSLSADRRRWRQQRQSRCHGHRQSCQRRSRDHQQQRRCNGQHHARREHHFGDNRETSSDVDAEHQVTVLPAALMPLVSRSTVARECSPSAPRRIRRPCRFRRQQCLRRDRASQRRRGGH